MGKSSASLKRKRSKNSSKAKASSKSKSKKYKSKKVRRREVSLSGSDYDDSRSLDTSASSSSKDRYSRKRDRSRTRKDVKGRNKRAWRRSYSSDSSEDTLYARKRKKAKRKKEHYEVREKPYRKKKLRREARVSSMSSGSWSCSTCQGGSAGNDDNQLESHRGRAERRDKDKRRLRGRSGSENSSRYRARSCSSCSAHSESSYEETEEKYIGKNKSRWLRSVITVTKEAEESGELCRNETKEEIVDDHDYPCRSNDSNEGGTKRELDDHTLPASVEKLRVDDEIGDVNANLNFTEPKLRDRNYNDSSGLEAYSAGSSESRKKETNETSGANLNCEDLESILRQRALENLKKFRGKVQSTAKDSDQKNKIDSQVKHPITDKHELVQGKSNVINAAAGTKFDKQTSVEEASLPVGRRNLIAYPRNNERMLNMDKDISDSTKHHLACALGKVIDADNPSETITESTNHRTGNLELNTSESCDDLLQSCSSLKETPGSGLPQEKLMIVGSTKNRDTFEAAHVGSYSSNVNNIRGMHSAVPEPSIHGPKFKRNNLNKEQDDVKDQSQFKSKQKLASHEPPNANEERNSTKTTQAAIQSINSSGRDVDELHNSATPESCLEGSSVQTNSSKLQDESNQGSQFEQKTMNVMRNGEMVQVSYKVYIPKKAPALARRQLKR